MRHPTRAALEEQSLNSGNGVYADTASSAPDQQSINKPRG